MADLKPLPALPTTGLLSVEAQNHRACLIKQFLSDIHEHGIEDRRDGWLYVFEEMLDDLSQQFIRGGWLASIKRTKETRQSRSSHRDTVDQTKETKSEKPLPAKPEPPLQQLRILAARSPPPHGEQQLGHLVLCVAPHGSRLPLPAEDSGFDVIPANIGCTFSAGTFALQDGEEEELDGTVLYGLSDGLELEESLRLVGGTFTFKGVTAPMQHHLLRKVLRLAVYVHLSLFLEQTVLSNSGVRLAFVRPKLPAHSPSTPTRSTGDVAITKESTNEVAKGKPQRSSIVPSSFTNFFLKRNFSYRRSQTMNPPAGRNGGSLDLTVIHPSSSADVATPRRSIEGVVSGLRLRRLSFLGDRRVSPRKSTSHPLQVKTEPTYHPFFLAIKRIEESKTYLSTSPGVVIAVPKLLLELAEKERRNDSQSGPLKRRLKGDERVALTSLLGWDGKDAEGRGMSGILGFLRHQEISVLCSAHVPPGPSNKLQNPSPPVAAQSSASSPASTQSNNDPAREPSAFTIAPASSHISSSAANLPQAGFSPCGKPHWITYGYYSKQNSDDFALGEWLRDIATRRTTPCETPGCKFLQGQHERRLIHDGVRLAIRLCEADEKKEKEKERGSEDDVTTNLNDGYNDGDIVMWESCAVCHAKTSRTPVSDGTYLFSFAKYLELLIYSPSICVLTPSLCKHTDPPPGPRSTLPWSRFNIIRHFSIRSTDISIALSPIEDIFELIVPKLQIIRGVEKATPPATGSKEHRINEDLQKKVLRKEIKKWWECVSDHLDKIEFALNVDDLSQKALPRLPSIDSAFNVFDTPEPNACTPRTHDNNSLAFPLMPPNTPNSPAKGVELPQKDSYFTTHSLASTNTQASQAPTVPPKDIGDPGKLLAALRHNFQKIEQLLYTQLAKTPEGSLNDVRRAFLATGQGTKNRLKAWQKKHLDTAKAKLVGDLAADEPPWWDKRCHAVPGGNIIVREDDWGSIIAHTLSTTDYQLELANLSMVRADSTSQPNASSTVESGTSSFFSVASGYRLFTSSSKNQPDPDQENVVWNEPEAYSAAISRKENPKDSTPLLSIRDVLRQKNIPEQTNTASSATPSRLSSLSSLHVPLPLSVKTKPDVGLNIQAADGKINASDDGEHASETLLQELEQATISSRTSSTKSDLMPNTNLEAVTTHIKTDRTASVISESKDSQDTIGKDGGPAGGDHLTDVVNAPTQPSQLPPPLPPKDGPRTPAPGHIELPSTSTAPSAWNPSPQHESTPSQSSGFASTLASGLSSAMRFVMNSEPTSRTSTPSGTANSNTKNQHHVLLADVATFNERPHIKYDWTIGKRLKFSCTVYYAKQFDVLRRRCGIQDVFLKSLSKSTNWLAEGGKSKSNFWKTSDDRFIIKTLVNAWNVADLQVLVDFAPSYFRYMDATASKPTVLCKVLGFYTIEIKNLETGAIQSKADLLVMENLFFNQNITKTFDLKGIQGRKVKSHGDTTKTFFDGEWIEGQQRTLTLVRPHSKVILRDAIKNDAEFLAKSNIMDYSLLLGVDEEKKEIACGLVDTIGSYTFAKTIEYKAKQGLQSGKEVTVMPPTEYQERFVSALEGYFVACPDKWSKPLDESKIISDPDLLPSVL